MKEKDEFLGSSEIKIISNIYRRSIERIVIVDNEEAFRDFYVFPCSPSDEDPIRRLQMFLFGEKPQHRTDRRCNPCYCFHSGYYNRVVGFRELFKLISQFFKIRFKLFLYRFKASMMK